MLWVYKILINKIMRGVVLVRNTSNDYQSRSKEQDNGGIRDDIWRKYKRNLKKDCTLEYYKLHTYFMTKKEKKLAKQKLNRIRFK